MTMGTVEIEAVRSLDAALQRMGSDVCVWSVALLIDQIVAERAPTGAEREALEALLRRRAGLD